MVAAAVIVVRRFRRSRGDERQQFKWFATSAGFLVVTVPIATAFNWTGIGGIVITFQLIALPVSVGIAVLRYRLYEIDVIIRRTLVYGTLSALLAGTYVAVVIGLQALFSSFAGGSNLAIAVSTLAVAALFMPVRSRVQRFVDRRFYRRRYDAQRTLESFGARLREQVELETLRADLRRRRRGDDAARARLAVAAGSGRDDERRPAPRASPWRQWWRAVALAGAVAGAAVRRARDSSVHRRLDSRARSADLAMTCAFAAVGARGRAEAAEESVGWLCSSAGAGCCSAGLRRRLRGARAAGEAGAATAGRSRGRGAISAGLWTALWPSCSSCS